MSFVTEIEKVIDALWPIVQEQHNIIKTVNIQVNSCNFIEIGVMLNSGTELSSIISWEQPVSALIEELREEIHLAANACSYSIEELMCAQNEIDELKKTRKKIKALDPSPLEELAMQAE